MFQTLGKLVSRTWPLLLVAWIGIWFGLGSSVRRSSNLLKWRENFQTAWHEVARDGEFAFLPKDSPSLAAEELFQKAWGAPLASNVVIVVRRESSQAGLLDVDKAFISDVLRGRLETIADEETNFLQPQHSRPANHSQPAEAENAVRVDDLKTITVRTLADKSVGRLLNSEDKHASLVLMELPTEFLDSRNARLIERVEKLIDRNGELQSAGLVPRGLDLALSGSATVGRDMIRAADESGKNTELWTVLLVLFLLILIYQAPLMAIIPLMTVAVATEISLALLATLSRAGVINLFAGIEVYVKVLCYGAGVDYCLFLIARYKEELDEGATLDQAVVNSLAKVGHALMASAGTVICGIFMMYFAEFGKFSQAGIAITIGLVIVLLAALTFSPSLLLLTRRWAFWPRVSTHSVSQTAGWVTATSLWSKILERNWGQLAWTSISELVRRRPGTVLLTSFAIMLPFACIGVQFHSNLSYGLLSELPQETTSVVGADAVAEHYPPGIAGPITVLIRKETGSFVDEDDGELTEEARTIMESLTERLRDQQETLQLADVRTLLHPFGGGLSDITHDDVNRQSSESEIQLASGSNPILRGLEQRQVKKRMAELYVSSTADLKGRVLRVDLVLKKDPFARNSIAQFESIRQSIETSIPAGLKVFTLGPTASIRDLKAVTDRDQIKIDILVLGAVFLILIVLLRRFTISLYLIVSVFFSYFVTLGVTFAVFWAMDPAGFAGLDWKVPMFLFTILIAVGEDYNIFLMTRIDEEQRQHGPIAGVISALQKTGSIISSCGIIMAGTFCSLMAGTLVGMHQLGFALAFGVLLDTFVVRPILVPSFLVLLYDGRLKSLKNLLARNEPALSPAAEVAQPLDVGGE